MGYYIDFDKFTIDNYRIKLKSIYLPPSRMVLKDRIDERFGYFESIGINNLKELILLLRNKNKFAELSAINFLTTDYLTILLRELNSLLPKPRKLSEFTFVNKEITQHLEKIGISNTEQLYNKVITETDRQKLADSIGIKYQEILELTKLADLSRIKWVGITYAQMLYDLGVDTVEKVTVSNPNELHLRINQLIKEKNIFKGAIGLNDVNILIESASELSLDIKY